MVFGSLDQAFAAARRLHQRHAAIQYDESKLFAAMFGIPPGCLPPDWTAFAAYNEAMWETDTLTVSSAACDIADRFFSGDDTWLCPPHWYRAITAHLLPPRLRQGFGLCYGPAERSLAEDAFSWILRIYPALPGRLRYVGPYHEATARLSGRAGPDIGTQLLNRFWIGQPWLG
jgi:uncharacterized protein (DUF2236 family)